MFPDLLNKLENYIFDCPKFPKFDVYLSCWKSLLLQNLAPRAYEFEFLEKGTKDRTKGTCKQL